MKTTKWVFDPSHSKISFKVKHLMITNVTGTFREFNGEVLTHNDDFTSAEIQFSINPNSVDTEAADRDNHLRSADFFDVSNFPKITFHADKMKDLGDDLYELPGTLEIRGTAKDVVLTAEFGGIMKDPWGNLKAGFSVNGKINRKDFGLNWNAALEAGGFLVGDDVKITADVQLLKQAN